uniref:Putative conserved secreted protein n=1 Tax=Ixodes scapularis TaxID=6945 RepID=A0A4D5RR07_IXOSC
MAEVSRSRSMAGLSSFLLVAAGALMTASAQEGQDCSCLVLVEDAAGQATLYEKSTTVLGSLCTDADYDFCAELCKNEMKQFSDTLDSKEVPFNTTVGQTLCERAKRKVTDGTLKLGGSVCHQDVREAGVENKQKLCCDEEARYVDC